MVHKQNWSLIISVKIVQVYTPYIKCDRSLIILWKFSDAQTMCNDWSMLLRYKIQSRQILDNADVLINKRPTGLGGHLSTNVLLTALSLTCQSLIFPFWSLTLWLLWQLSHFYYFLKSIFNDIHSFINYAHKCILLQLFSTSMQYTGY